MGSVEESKESQKIETVLASTSAADDEEAEGRRLVRNYGKSLKAMEEYSLNYLTYEIHHPVITCFRELTRTDITSIISSGKLKKSFSSLELSYLYLGLVDLFATVNNNPLYGEQNNSKFSKNLPVIVQRILIEFKNIIGAWALNGKEVFSTRANIILRYLRTLSPMFAKAGFERDFIRIIDNIQTEIDRLKSNQEKLKHVGMGTFSSNKSKSDSKNPNVSEDGEREALNEIVINTTAKEHQDDDVTVIEEEENFEIFGKPLKGSPKLTNMKRKKVAATHSKPSSNDQNGDPGTTASAVSSHTSNGSLSKGADSPKTTVALNGAGKRSATHDLTKSEGSKKLKLDSDESPSTQKSKPGIRDFFQSTSSVSSSSTETGVTKPKPAVNAFALMMNKSREIAQKKKLDKKCCGICSSKAAN